MAGAIERLSVLRKRILNTARKKTLLDISDIESCHENVAKDVKFVVKVIPKFSDTQSDTTLPYHWYPRSTSCSHRVHHTYVHPTTYIHHTHIITYLGDTSSSWTRIRI